MAGKVISLADYLAGRGKSKRVSSAEARHHTQSFEDTDDCRNDSRRSSTVSPTIIPFPEPRHPLPAA
jgi:hypothetical protein